MADDAIDPITPSPRIQPRREPPEEEENAAPGPILKGRIVTVTPGHPHDGEAHILDVTVGGSAYTEILVRVPNAPSSHLEGRGVTLHVDS